MFKSINFESFHPEFFKQSVYAVVDASDRKFIMTVGLTGYDLPEIIMTGRNITDLSWYILDMAAKAIKNKFIPIGLLLDSFCIISQDNSETRIHTFVTNVDNSDPNLAEIKKQMTRIFEGKTPRYVQICYQSKEGLFPFEPNYDTSNDQHVFDYLQTEPSKNNINLN